MHEEGLSGAAWRTSSYSGNGASCVEVAPVNDGVATRDSKHPTGPVLYFKPTGWSAFLDGIENGRFKP